MPDWKMTRLVVVLLAALAPVYFFALVFALPFQMTPFSDASVNWSFQYVGVPITFSITWVAMMYLERYRLANTVHLMRQTTTAIPLRWRVFYGTNAMFVIVFFILPLATPILSIIGGLMLAGNVIYRMSIGKLGLIKPAAVIAVVVAIGLCLLPFFIMIQFIPGYLSVWEAILDGWSSFWFNVVYGVSQCLVNALSFGAPFYFVFFAAQEYDKGLYGQVYTRTPTARIRIGELILFVVFVVLYLPPVPTPIGTIYFLNQPHLFKNFINYISLAIVVIMILVKWRLKVSDNSTMGGFSNILIVGLFLMVEIFFQTEVLVVTLTVWVAFLIFASVILANFMRASSREMY